MKQSSGVLFDFRNEIIAQKMSESLHRKIAIMYDKKLLQGVFLK